MLHTLDSYTYKTVCQSHLNKTERRGEKSPPPPRCPLLQTQASVETAVQGKELPLAADTGICGNCRPGERAAPCSGHGHLYLWKLPSRGKSCITIGIYDDSECERCSVLNLHPDVVIPGKDVESEGLIYTQKGPQDFFLEAEIRRWSGSCQGHLWGERPQQREEQVRRGSGLCPGQLNYSLILTTTERSSLSAHKGLKRRWSISSLLM